jgi:hypothetical protein
MLMHEINWTHYNRTREQFGSPTILMEDVDCSPTIELHEDGNGNVSTASYISYSISSLLLVSLVLYMLFIV